MNNILSLKDYCELIKPLNPRPGEHHFVATYLVPIIAKKLNGYKKIFYINPDGTKSRVERLIADIEYEIKSEPKHVEVKMGKQITSETISISLTRGQIKEWDKLKKFKLIIFIPPSKIEKKHEAGGLLYFSKGTMEGLTILQEISKLKKELDHKKNENKKTYTLHLTLNDNLIQINSNIHLSKNL